MIKVEITNSNSGASGWASSGPSASIAGGTTVVRYFGTSNSDAVGFNDTNSGRSVIFTGIFDDVTTAAGGFAESAVRSGFTVRVFALSGDREITLFNVEN